MRTPPPTAAAGSWGPQIVQLVGVYDADGGLAGELRYVVGHLLGRVECALCDITHSPIRRKREWDRLVAELGLPLIAVHRNELPPPLSLPTVRDRLPAVYAVRTDGSAVEVLTRADLAAAQGSVAQFRRVLLERLEETAGDR